MPLTTDQYAVAVTWVGDVPQATLDARFDRFTAAGSGEDKAFSQMVEEELRYQLAKFMRSPSQISLPDGTSVGTSENIRALRERLKDFMASGMDAAGSSVSVRKLCRPDGR